jgi:hypothetical protein
MQQPAHRRPRNEGKLLWPVIVTNSYLNTNLHPLPHRDRSRWLWPARCIPARNVTLIWIRGWYND